MPVLVVSRWLWPASPQVMLARTASGSADRAPAARRRASPASTAPRQTRASSPWSVERPAEGQWRLKVGWLECRTRSATAKRLLALAFFFHRLQDLCVSAWRFCVFVFRVVRCNAQRSALHARNCPLRRPLRPQRRRPLRPRGPVVFTSSLPTAPAAPRINMPFRPPFARNQPASQLDLRSLYGP